ncbi:MAG: hypothetical protein H7Z11_10810 [Verrucomicrobia bacterium]|nr:hypothetical protein [Leptolyngbya sp. ES-bin-22]
MGKVFHGISSSQKAGHQPRNRLQLGLLTQTQSHTWRAIVHKDDRGGTDEHSRHAPAIAGVHRTNPSGDSFGSSACGSEASIQQLRDAKRSIRSFLKLKPLSS